MRNRLSTKRKGLGINKKQLNKTQKGLVNSKNLETRKKFRLLFTKQQLAADLSSKVHQKQIGECLTGIVFKSSSIQSKIITELATHHIPQDEDVYAYQSGIPGGEMTEEEQNEFPEITSSPANANRGISHRVKNVVSLFLQTRNQILRLWHINPWTELTIERVFYEMKPLSPEEIHMVAKLHSFLSRQNLINFGIFRKLSPPIPRLLDFMTGSWEPKMPKILILGAGISGLMAARQLEYNGFDVEVLESRSRVGGRINTSQTTTHAAELGAMIITGLGRNPLTTLARQLRLELHVIGLDCPLYSNQKCQIDSGVDKLVFKEFNSLLDQASTLTQMISKNAEDSHVAIQANSTDSLGIVIERLIRKEQASSRCDGEKELIAAQQQVILHLKSVKEAQDKVVCLHSEYSKARSQLVLDDISQKFVLRCKKRDLKLAHDHHTVCMFRYQVVKKKCLDVEAELKENCGHPVYSSSIALRALDWHIANLEFANSAPMDELSLRNWDQDDDYGCTGLHLTASGGLSQIAIGLSMGLNVELTAEVIKVFYGSSKPSVRFKQHESLQPNMFGATQTLTHTGDAVLCTIPLGCLKKLVSTSTNQPSRFFTPSLPAWKRQAIHRLGFGNLNKVLLCFDHVFWDDIHRSNSGRFKYCDMFGYLGTASTIRGENFLFFVSPDEEKPWLLSLISGDAAHIVEKVSDECVTNRCLQALRSMFDSEIPEPVEYHVTRWASDPWSCGTYSYVAAKASGEDYKVMAQPIRTTHTDSPEDSPSEHPAQLYFAGEHTSQRYPATVHGALLSGLREATRITDQFMGKPWRDTSSSEDYNQSVTEALHVSETMNRLVDQVLLLDQESYRVGKDVVVVLSKILDKITCPEILALSLAPAEGRI